MKLKAARQLDAQIESQRQGRDHAHNTEVQHLYTKKDIQLVEFSILPAFPQGAGPGSSEFVSYMDDSGDFTDWLEAYIIHEGFGGEIRNKTASPQNWNPEAVDPFAGVTQVVRKDKDLYDQLVRTGNMVQSNFQGEGGKVKHTLPWSTSRYNYVNARVHMCPGFSAGDIRVLRAKANALSFKRGGYEGGAEEGTIWGLLDYLGQVDPRNPAEFVYPDPTHPDECSILKLWKSDPPNGTKNKWWRMSFTRHSPITISDQELAQRADLSKVVNETGEEDSAKHFYEFLTDSPGLIDVMEELYPQFRPLGRDRVRPTRRPAAQRPAPAEEDDGGDEIPGIPPRRATSPAPARSAAPAEEEAEPAPRTPARAPRTAATVEAPVREARTPSRTPARKATVGGAKPAVPSNMVDEAPVQTASMAAREERLEDLLGEEIGD